jgi:hypothetical protein
VVDPNLRLEQSQHAASRRPSVTGTLLFVGQFADALVALAAILGVDLGDLRGEAVELGVFGLGRGLRDPRLRRPERIAARFSTSASRALAGFFLEPVSRRVKRSFAIAIYLPWIVVWE